MISDDRIERERDMLAATFTGTDVQEPDPLLDAAAFFRVVIQEYEELMAAAGEGEYISDIKNGSEKPGKKKPAAALVYEKLFSWYQDLLDKIQAAYPFSASRHKEPHKESAGQESAGHESAGQE